MTERTRELKSKFCSGCLRTVDLEPVHGDEARCPRCSRRYAVGAGAAVALMRRVLSAA